MPAGGDRDSSDERWVIGVRARRSHDSSSIHAVSGLFFFLLRSLDARVRGLLATRVYARKLPSGGRFIHPLPVADALGLCCIACCGTITRRRQESREGDVIYV